MSDTDHVKPGEIVKLTGDSWDRLNMRGQTAVVIDIDLDGDPLIEDPAGGVLAIYQDLPEIDYSAERLEVSERGSEHHHGPRIVACAGCGQDRWCGYGPCQCGALTPCQEVTG